MNLSQQPAAGEQKPKGAPDAIADRGLFRKAAIEHRFAEGHVDDILRVSRPSDWMVIGTITLLAALVLIWAFVGSLPVMVQGNGLILPAGGIVQIKSENGGIVVSAPPVNGRHVQPNDLLAVIVPETGRQNLKNAIEKEGNARRSYTAEKSAYAALNQTAEEARNTYLTLMEENLKQLKEILADQEKQYQNLKELSDQQMVTVSDLLAAEAAAATAYQNYNQAKIQLAQQKVSMREDLLQREISLQTAEAGYLEAREERAAQEALVKTGEIRTPIAGIIQQSTLKTGELVPAGAAVCLIESAGPPAIAYQFFPTDDAQRLNIGAPVQLEVPSYPADRYGKLAGKVSAVDPLPATPELIEASCAYSPNLVQSLESGAAVSLVTVQLETRNRDGKLIYARTGAGTPFPVLSGMICTGAAVVERQVPITLVIPALKNWFGVTEM